MNLWRHKRHRKPSATTSNLWRIWSHKRHRNPLSSRPSFRVSPYESPISILLDHKLKLIPKRSPLETS
ncbi:hypothetical protein BRARA_G00935 [Brassica rapa]|uniref:Uncharacterized protein n=1 Tax=Brassica campestris TaxID=3711 RepID=A0A397YR87_BRACM|nr:hypothetical protein BRARA_G00935 [Brassica rapa]